MIDYECPVCAGKWAVEYTSEVECEYGYTHEVSNVLVGLATEAEAKQRAKTLKGKITQKYYTPKLSDEEIRQLNEVGIPVERNNYGLGFRGVPAVFSDAPSTLNSLIELYKHYKGNDLAVADHNANTDTANPPKSASTREGE